MFHGEHCTLCVWGGKRSTLSASKKSPLHVACTALHRPPARPPGSGIRSRRRRRRRRGCTGSGRAPSSTAPPLPRPSPLGRQTMHAGARCSIADGHMRCPLLSHSQSVLCSLRVPPLPRVPRASRRAHPPGPGPAGAVVQRIPCPRRVAEASWQLLLPSPPPPSPAAVPVASAPTCARAGNGRVQGSVATVPSSRRQRLPESPDETTLTRRPRAARAHLALTPERAARASRRVGMGGDHRAGASARPRQKGSGALACRPPAAAAGRAA
jgi:hypothetical protein